jgi:HEAT repeat protein
MRTADADLLKAASAGDLAAVSRALEGGADVNARDQFNNTSLNGAALFGHLEVVKRLLEAGADVENKGSGGGLTPLVNAASRGHFDVAQILVERGARVTDDLISVLQTRVNILEEDAEGGMATREGVAAWKEVLEFFVTQRLKQDLPDAVPLLASSDAAVRKHAVGGMAAAAKRGIDVAAAASALPALLVDADADVRVSASVALAHHRARSGDWPGVDELLASRDARTRVAAAEALIRVETADPSLVRSLGALLQDSEAEARKTAAIAIATLPREGVDATSLLPRMSERLSDAEPTVRRSAAFAFSAWSKRGLHDYCAPALSALRSAAEHDENDAVRQFAAQVVAASQAAS